MLRSLLLIGCFFFALAASAQELNCQVTVNSSQIEGSEKTVFNAMETSIREFINNRKWTSDIYQIDERIECSFLINLTERLSADQYKATLQIQARRPVYGTAYYTTTFNHIDNDFTFRYLQFDVLDFSESQYLSNLTSVLGFYVYMILGTDYDTFSKKGGEPFFQKAIDVVNNAQTANDAGWKAFESTDNRYWLVTNLVDPRFESLRICSYDYHRQGFDLLANKLEEGRENITVALESLRKLHRAVPNSLNMKLWFQAKGDEIVDLYSDANPEEKTRIINLLDQIDPARTSKYSKIR